ncbi:MAG: hypothetical protein ACYCYL_06290 [Acidithiobacillus sp.]
MDKFHALRMANQAMDELDAHCLDLQMPSLFPRSNLYSPQGASTHFRALHFLKPCSAKKELYRI